LTVLFFISADSFTDKIISTTTFKVRLDKILEIKNLEKNMDDKKWLAHNKNYMSIGVAVRTRMSAARNNGFGVRQENSPQSPTAHSSVRYGQPYQPGK